MEPIFPEISLDLQAWFGGFMKVPSSQLYASDSSSQPTRQFLPHILSLLLHCD